LPFKCDLQRYTANKARVKAEKAVAEVGRCRLESS
jgi:hypothetical protein